MPTRRLVVLAVLVLLGLSAAPAAALDDTPPVPLPAEPSAILLPGLPVDGLTVDLDGDGVRELVRVIVDPSRSPGMIVDAWWLDRLNGEPRTLHSAPIRRDASVDEQFSGLPRPDRDGTLGLIAGDPVRLLVMRDAGRERAVVAAEGAPDATGRSCCLTLWEVVPVDDELRLVRLGGIQQEAAALAVADLDGDGTDELVAPEVSGDLGQLPIRIYHPDREDPSTDLVTADVSDLFVGFVTVGETDGRPGDDVLLLGERSQGDQPVNTALLRLTWDAGEPRIEVASLSEPSFASILPLDDGPLIALSRLVSEQTATARWPARGQLEVVDTVNIGGTPVAVLGTGATTHLVLRNNFVPQTGVVLDGDLEVVDRLEAADPLAWFQEPGPALAYGAPLSRAGATAPTEAVFDGRRITVTDDGGIEVQVMRRLLGHRSIGTLGADDAIMALDRGLAEEPFEHPLFRSQPADATLLVDAASVLTADATDGELVPGLRGAIRDPQEVGTVLTAQREIEVLVDAPAGSRVSVKVGRPAPSFESLRWTDLDAGVTAIPLTLGPSESTYVFLVVSTPTGSTYATRLRVERRTAPPTLTVEAPMAPWSSTVPITGTTDPGTSVAVNGTPVSVDAGGRFATSVAAALAPLQVSVEAVDPLGNRASSSLSVVGWVDYRRLPWIPIMAVSTLVVAAALWLFVPGPRRWTRRGPEDDAILEEIES